MVGHKNVHISLWRAAMLPTKAQRNWKISVKAFIKTIMGMNKTNKMINHNYNHQFRNCKY